MNPWSFSTLEIADAGTRVTSTFLAGDSSITIGHTDDGTGIAGALVDAGWSVSAGLYASGIGGYMPLGDVPIYYPPLPGEVIVPVEVECSTSSWFWGINERGSWWGLHPFDPLRQIPGACLYGSWFPLGLTKEETLGNAVAAISAMSPFYATWREEPGSIGPSYFIDLVAKAPGPDWNDCSAGVNIPFGGGGGVMSGGGYVLRSALSGSTRIELKIYEQTASVTEFGDVAGDTADMHLVMMEVRVVGNPASHNLILNPTLYSWRVVANPYQFFVVPHGVVGNYGGVFVSAPYVIPEYSADVDAFALATLLPVKMFWGAGGKFAFNGDWADLTNDAKSSVVAVMPVRNAAAPWLTVDGMPLVCDAWITAGSPHSHLLAKVWDAVLVTDAPGEAYEYPRRQYDGLTYLCLIRQVITEFGNVRCSLWVAIGPATEGLDQLGIPMDCMSGSGLPIPEASAIRRNYAK